MTVHILTIGDEILIGQTVDTNSAWIGSKLVEIGAEVVEITTVPDTPDGIRRGLEHALSNAQIVLTTGGLGPTKDDITKKALAQFFNVPLVFDQPTFDRIVRIFHRFGRTVTEAHRTQCMMPSNARLLPNAMGTAPGMWFDHKEQVVVALPGVPFEMKSLLEKEVLPELSRRFQYQPIAHRTLLTAGLGETQLAELVRHFEEELPAHVKLAYLPSLGQVRLRLSGRGTDQAELDREMDQKRNLLYKLVREHVYGFDEDSLEGRLGEALRERGLTIGTAESCTGGRIAHHITNIAGSSDYFKGSIVAYANSVKVGLLNVSPDSLEAHGAVSEPVVCEMVRGALDSLKTDLAIATSGIAGPGGGTREKPVGTIWIAVGTPEKIRTQKLQLGKDRIKNIELTTVFALEMARKFVLGM